MSKETLFQGVHDKICPSYFRRGGRGGTVRYVLTPCKHVDTNTSLNSSEMGLTWVNLVFLFLP